MCSSSHKDSWTQVITFVQLGGIRIIIILLFHQPLIELDLATGRGILEIKHWLDELGGGGGDGSLLYASIALAS